MPRKSKKQYGRDGQYYRKRITRPDGKTEDVYGRTVQELTEKGRPVLVGTTDVETSELLSRMLRIRGIKHNVLNAKEHARGDVRL